MSDTLGAFYGRLAQTPPFDLESNPLGFPFRRPSAERAVSDESAHMPLLRLLASSCASVAEFGLRTSSSTAAILMGLGDSGNRDAVLYSVDRERTGAAQAISLLTLPCRWEFWERDVLGDWELPEVDWLHVDDYHDGHHVRQELARHGHKARRLLSFHDTVSQGPVSLEGSEGINAAIDGYAAENGWKLIYEAFFNHGLRVYARE